MVRCLGLLLLLAGCAAPPGTTPVPFTAAQIAMFCLVNCPLTVSVTESGMITDTVGQPQPRLLAETIRATNEGRAP